MAAFRYINQGVTCAYTLVGAFGQARLPEHLVPQRFISRVLKREHLFPILLHIDHGPALAHDERHAPAVQFDVLIPPSVN
jgi:hypothetical protein